MNWRPSTYSTFLRSLHSVQCMSLVFLFSDRCGTTANSNIASQLQLLWQYPHKTATLSIQFRRPLATRQNMHTSRCNHVTTWGDMARTNLESAVYSIHRYVYIEYILRPDKKKVGTCSDSGLRTYSWIYHEETSWTKRVPNCGGKRVRWNVVPSLLSN